MTTLLDLVPNLKKIANSHGGEWAGACVFCGGKDRFHLQPAYAHPDGDTGRWFCRQCSPHWDDAPALVMRLHGCRYPEALQILGASTLERSNARTLQAPATPTPPDATWQARAWQFVQASADILLSDDGAKARQWLYQRGFNDITAASAMLGYNPTDQWDDPAAWGLPDDAKRVWLPRGIVIPWAVDGHLWNVEIRRPLTKDQVAAGEMKYISVKGGAKQAMLGADKLNRDKPTVLVEGAFDRLAVMQAAGDLVDVVAAGSTTGARQSTWVLRLAVRKRGLIGFDADDAGDAAAAWWLQVLGERATRWRPDYDDPAAMLAQGADLRAWVQAGLDLANTGRGNQSVVAPDPAPDDLGHHCACGAEAARYLEDGKPICEPCYSNMLWDEMGQHPRTPSALSPQPSALPVWDRDQVETAKAKKRPDLFPIPAATRPQTCPCGATFYWIHHRADGPAPQPGRAIPISINPDLHPDSVAPTKDTPGAGIRHHIDCPLRDQFRKGKQPPTHPLDTPAHTATTEAA